MFENVGAKIKIWVTVFFWLDMVASFILGIVIAAEYDEAWIFFVATPILCSFTWISCLFLYGFGELIESNTECRHELETIQRTLQYTQNNQGANGEAAKNNTGAAAGSRINTDNSFNDLPEI